MHTGFDMDPFVIVSFGKKTFRTRVIRHSLNPVFDEQLIFQVLNSEKHYAISFSVYDRDLLSSNDFVAQASLPISDLIDNGPTPDLETGLYKVAEPWKHAESTHPRAHRHGSKLYRILSHSGSSTSLGGKKNDGVTDTSAPKRVSIENISVPTLVGSTSSTLSPNTDGLLLVRSF
jgi:phosphatidylserine decarboxylase